MATHPMLKTYVLPKRVWLVVRKKGHDLSTAWHTSKRGATRQKRKFEKEDGGRDRTNPWIVVPYSRE